MGAAVEGSDWDFGLYYRPFVIERPDELRGLVAALAERLAASTRGG